MNIFDVCPVKRWTSPRRLLCPKKFVDKKNHGYVSVVRIQRLSKPRNSRMIHNTSAISKLFIGFFSCQMSTRRTILQCIKAKQQSTVRDQPTSTLPMTSADFSITVQARVIVLPARGSTQKINRFCTK